jgi:uncharacterized low-complexity protein
MSLLLRYARGSIAHADAQTQCAGHGAIPIKPLDTISGDLMSNNSRKPVGVTKPVAVAFSAAMLAASMAPVANAAVNPFSASPLASGYGQVNMQKAAETTKPAEKPAEGSCGSHGDKPKCEGKCGEGKCGAEKKAKCEGKCGGMDGAKKDAAHEGKCGEGKCGGKAAK